MKNKVTMAIMALLLVSVLPSVYAYEFQSSIIDGLNEGETTIFELEGERYAVTAMNIEGVLPPTVTFEVNGEISYQLSIGQSQHFDNLGLEIENIFIIEDGESLGNEKVKMKITCLSGCEIRYNHAAEYPQYSEIKYPMKPSVYDPNPEIGVLYTAFGEGQTKTIGVGNQLKEIEVIKINNVFPPTVTLNIDGEITEELTEGVSTNYGDYQIEIDAFYSKEGYSEDGDGEYNKILMRLECIGGCSKYVDNIVKDEYDWNDESLEDIFLVNENEENERVIENFFCSDGCELDNKCIPFGTRANVDGEPKYCSLSGSLLNQKEDGSIAENDYECFSNSAKYGECENIQEQRSAMKSIFGWLSKLFG